MRPIDRRQALDTRGEHLSHWMEAGDGMDVLIRIELTGRNNQLSCEPSPLTLPSQQRLVWQ